MFDSAEAFLIVALQWLRLAVEAIGATIIAVGVIIALARLVGSAGDSSRRAELFHRTRLTLAHALALALEFQLAADILSTAVSPSWEQIGKLAAIAVIRTGLNFFLMRELREVEGGSRGVTAGVAVD